MCVCVCGCVGALWAEERHTSAVRHARKSRHRCRHPLALPVSPAHLGALWVLLLLMCVYVRLRRWWPQAQQEQAAAEQLKVRRPSPQAAAARGVNSGRRRRRRHSSSGSSSSGGRAGQSAGQHPPTGDPKAGAGRGRARSGGLWHQCRSRSRRPSSICCVIPHGSWGWWGTGGGSSSCQPEHRHLHICRCCCCCCWRWRGCCSSTPAWELSCQ